MNIDLNEDWAFFYLLDFWNNETIGKDKIYRRHITDIQWLNIDKRRVGYRLFFGKDTKDISGDMELMEPLFKWWKSQ